MTSASANVNLAIHENEIQLTSTLLGEGAHAKVFKAKWRGVTVAVKCLHERFQTLILGGESSREQLDDILSLFHKEAQAMCGLLHPHVVRLFGVCAPGTRHVCLVMELMAMSLHDRAKEDPALSSRSITHILHDITSALAYLHDHNILHRDISPRNILLNEDTAQHRWFAKLSDFATAKVVQTIGFDQYSATSGSFGTYAYLPYEALDRDPMTGKLEYSSAVDVYSIGAVGLYAVLGKEPGNTPKAKPMYLQLVGSDHVLYKVLSECLDDVPAKRPSSASLQARLEGHLMSCEIFAEEASGCREGHKCIGCVRKNDEISLYKEQLREARVENQRLLLDKSTLLEEAKALREQRDAQVAAFEAMPPQIDADLSAEENLGSGFGARALAAGSNMQQKSQMANTATQESLSTIAAESSMASHLDQAVPFESAEPWHFMEKVRAHSTVMKSWSRVEIPMLNDPDSTFCTAVHLDQLYVIAHSKASGNVVMRSHDRQNWQQLQPPPATIFCHGLLSHGGNLYCLSDPTPETDPKRHIVIYKYIEPADSKPHMTWRRLVNGRCPNKQWNPSFFGYADSLLLVGGWNGESSLTVVSEYSLQKQCWLEMSTWPSLPKPLGSLQEVALRDSLYLLGGAYTRQKKYISSNTKVFQLSIENNSPVGGWDTSVLPETPLGDCGACCVNGHAAVAGGFSDQGNQDGVFILDKTRRKWLDLPPLSMARSRPSLAFFKGSLLAFGGGTEGGWSNVVEELIL